MFIMKSGKGNITDGIELLNQERIRMLREKENYNFIGIFEVNTNKQAEKKEKITKEYLRRTRYQSLQEKSHERNKHLDSLEMEKEKP